MKKIQRSFFLIFEYAFIFIFKFLKAIVDGVFHWVAVIGYINDYDFLFHLWHDF